MTAAVEQYYDREGVVRLARSRGLIHINENSVETAAYRGSRPLKKTKIAGRIYYSHSAVEAWLAGNIIDD